MTTIEAIEAAIKSSETLKATNIKIIEIRETYDIERDQKRVRVEMTFDLR